MVFEFHPESICTEYGRQLMTNFHRLTVKYMDNYQLFDKRAEKIPDNVLALSILESAATPSISISSSSSSSSGGGN